MNIRGMYKYVSFEEKYYIQIITDSIKFKE